VSSKYKGKRQKEKGKKAALIQEVDEIARTIGAIIANTKSHRHTIDFAFLLFTFSLNHCSLLTAYLIRYGG
jgi:hypothetical protein